MSGGYLSGGYLSGGICPRIDRLQPLSFGCFQNILSFDAENSGS